MPIVMKLFLIFVIFKYVDNIMNIVANLLSLK